MLIQAIGITSRLRWQTAAERARPLWHLPRSRAGIPVAIRAAGL